MNITCDLYRNPGEAWGFRLQGGSEYRAQLGVKKVVPGGPAARTLRAMDEIITINHVPTKNMTHKDAEHMIKNSGESLNLTIRRGENPLAHYRPEGPIKFNVQRAQAAQQALGVSNMVPPAQRQTYQAPAQQAYPPVNGYMPVVNGYPQATDIYQLQSPVQYNSFY